MKQHSKWLIFTLVAIAQFMVVLDVAITNVALPTIKQDLHFSTNVLQWVITAYILTFGGFLLLGGRVADLFGRRRVLLGGIAAFTTFSLLIGLSHSSLMLIILRALQGMSAAFMSPTALSITLVTFKEGPDRNKALGYWTLVATGGAAVGLLLGGVLTEYFGWRFNFFINVPVGIVISLLISKFVVIDEQEDAASKRHVDLPGAVLITSSLVALVLAFSEAPVWGWFSRSVIGILVLACILAVAFVYNESRSKHPLMPLSILRIRNVVGANLVMAPLYACMLGTFFLATLYTQTILHYSPVVTGLSILPFPIVLGFMSTKIPTLVSRYGYKRFLIAGPIIIGLGLLWLSRLPVHGNYFIDLLPSFILMPVGVGMSFMPLIAAATAGVPAKESGLASGLISTSQQMGGALGLAILSSIASSATAGYAHMGISAALVHGYDRAFLIGAVFMVYALVVAMAVIRQHARAVVHEVVDIGL